MYREYTNPTELSKRLITEAQEAERRHRRQIGNAQLWNQRDWFVSKLNHMNAETRQSILNHGIDDDDNQELRVCRAPRRSDYQMCSQDAIDEDLRAAFNVFGKYLAHQYVETWVLVARNDIADSAELATLALPTGSIAAITTTHLASLDELIRRHHVRRCQLAPTTW